LIAGLFVATVAAFTTIQAQIPGRNVNMVSGTKWPEGDPFLQRQNEPSIAASTRNPLHLLGGSNDYRTVDVPFPADGDNETGDAWLGLFKSFDGGQRWISTLLPGYPQDQSEAGLASPLKAYSAGADAVVRAGTNGLVYFSGLAFVRGEGGKSGIFLSRFIDNNNQEAGDPFAYLGTVMVAQSTPGVFLDKPWMVVDVPRGDAATCTITSNNEIQIDQRGKSRGNRDDRRRGRGRNNPRPVVQRIKAGAVYVAYTSFTGEGASLRSEILMTRSVNCGASWSNPFRVSAAGDQLNQGSSLTIDPRDGSVFVAWRRFANTAKPEDDGIMVARLPYGGKKLDAPGRAYKFPKRKGQKVGQSLHRIFEHGRVKARPTELADIAEFDQGSSPYSFRTNAYPTTATDGAGRVYVAWTQRGFPADSRPDTGPSDGARIVMVTTRNGRSFTQPQAVDDDGQKGHQLMPSLAFAGGKLMLVYYDLRETKANVHGYRVTEQDGLLGNGLRHTIDIRSAMASPGDDPAFAPSVRVSEYLMGVNSRTSTVEQLQVNPPNLPMFRQGTTPFMGDYIDVTAAPAFVPTAKGGWAFNTADTGEIPIFHAAWTDNRDVRPPAYDTNGDGNPWNDYTAAQMSPATSPSVFDGTTVPQCVPGNAGSRNQNVYSARITGGLLAGSPGNAKPLSPTLQRGFVVFAQNATPETRSFRMTIRSQPVGGRASFEQFSAPGQTPLTSIEMKVPPRSTASRTVYATSTDANAMIAVDVVETTPPDAAGNPVSLGLTSTVVLNPDIENPDIENPDIENPDIENPDIENAEVYNPDIENPDIENPDIENVRVANPDIENPDIENPDIENPDIENVRVANPDIENIAVTNPDIENPDIENPDIENPDIENPDIENGAVADVTWKVSNTGNTTAAFNVNVFLAAQDLPAGVKTQLVLYKTYRTPVTVPNGCQLGFQTRNVLVSSILNPTFIRPNSGGVPDQNDPAETNASMWLAPGEEGRITLRVIHDDLPPNFEITDAEGNTKTVRIDPAFAPTTSATPTISSQGVGTEDAATGQTDPPLVTPTGANLFFLQMPGNAAVNAAIAPTVRVQVRDNLTGTPVAGAVVTLDFGNNPGEASLAGATSATTELDGIASFPALSVSAPGAGYTLVAAATTGGVTGTALSIPFDVFGSTVVVNTNDSGAGSLRAAILNANATPGVQTITFAIPGEGPAVIFPSAALPPITESVVIDGFPQVGAHDGQPIVEVRGPGDTVGWSGFELQASAITIRGLAITQFGQAIFAGQSQTGHVLERNYIGTNRSNEDRGNNFGVIWRSSSSAIRDNVISGNNGDGLSLVIGASSNLVSNNRIGVRPDGTAALPNGNNGVTLYDAANNNAFEGNIISGNGGVGVDIQKNTLVAVSGTRFRNNTIGLDDTGAAMANLGGGIRVDSAPNTVIGEPGAGNTISGNQVAPSMEGDDYGGGPGILVKGWTSVADMPVIQDNRIGTDAGGNEARPNRFEGVFLYAPARVGGSSLESRGNRIAGNGVTALGGGTGVAIVNAGAGGSIVQGNSIGVAAGGASLGNGYSGITVYGDVQSVLIGGDAPGEANTIAGNAAAGIAIYTVGDGGSPQEITIAGNAIYDNGGLGIDLDANANNQQVAPELSNARIGETGTLVDFAMPGLEGNYDLRFFAGPACDPSGSGEGAAFLGTINANSGAYSLGAVPANYVITATATDSDGNTSEFSACSAVVDASGVSVSGIVRYSATPLQGVTVKLILGPNAVMPPLTTTVTDAGGAYNFTGVAPGSYSLRVDGPNAAYITWGAVPVQVANTNITVPFSLPKVIALSTPSNNATNQATLPTLTWQANPEATTYTIQINTTNGWVPVAPGATSGTNSYTLLTPLTPGEQYTWQVDAYDSGGRSVGTTDTAFRFTVAAPPVTVIGTLGGTGGGAFGPLSCPTGTAAVGIRVATGADIDYALTSAELMCSDNSSTAKFGGGTVPNTPLSCAPGDRMVGMVGSLAYPYGAIPVVGGVAPRCQSLSGGAITEPWAPRPSGVSGAGPFDCPAGQVVKGVQGGEGAVVDRIQLVCAAP